MSKFYQIPAELLGEKYKNYKLTAADMLVYSLLLDRWRQSKGNGNGWRNRNGEVFCYYSRSELAIRARLSERSLVRILTRLKNASLIRERCRAYHPTKIVVRDLLPDKPQLKEPKPNPKGTGKRYHHEGSMEDVRTAAKRKEVTFDEHPDPAG